jgi:hypothetical protein
MATLFFYCLCQFFLLLPLLVHVVVAGPRSPDPRFDRTSSNGVSDNWSGPEQPNPSRL